MGVPAQRDHWDAGKHQEGVGGGKECGVPRI